ncbi:MAG: CpaF family protein [Candidatus Omnitrophica bacterium]|nr:CpaF family protein [Candidatus Omnitrophota bacterium]
MDKLEKIQQIKEDVRNKVMARVKKTSLNYEADESQVRRQIEAALETVVQQKMEGHIEDAVRRFIVEEIINGIFGLGPIDRLVNDPGVWEIMVNGPKEVYVEREGKLQKTDVVFEDEGQLHFYIERILSPSGRRVTEFEPYIDARLPDGSRLNVVRAPIAPSGPVLTIRKARHKVLEMQDLINKRSIDEKTAHFLKACVRNHLNIAIVGGPGAGKTTILNILASFIPDVERVITIEDTLELRMENKHRVALETRPSNIEGKGEITIRDLVRNALHMRPDRIIIGEVRGGETLDMLQCMNIGRVGSMTTMHANSALDALLRLETMAMMGSVNVSPELIKRQIVSAIDLIIVVDRLLDGTRRVISITEVLKNNAMEYELKDIYALARKDEGGAVTFELKGTGYIPAFIEKFREVEHLPAEFRR